MSGARGDRTPVRMRTAQYLINGRVLALNLGADDYLAKPFVQRALEVRIYVLHHREQWPLTGLDHAGHADL